MYHYVFKNYVMTFLKTYFSIFWQRYQTLKNSTTRNVYEDHFNRRGVIFERLILWSDLSAQKLNTRCETAVSITRIKRYSEKPSVVHLMNQNQAHMLFWVWDALSAEIRVLQNIPLHANVNPKLVEKYHVRHAVRSDAKSIHA